MIHEDVVKMIKVVDSCNTAEQLYCANNYINLMITKYARLAPPNVRTARKYGHYYFIMDDMVFDDLKRILLGIIHTIKDI